MNTKHHRHARWITEDACFWLKALRHMSGKSLKATGKDMHTCWQRLGKIERNQVQPKLTEVFALADYYGVTPDEFCRLVLSVGSKAEEAEDLCKKHPHLSIARFFRTVLK